MSSTWILVKPTPNDGDTTEEVELTEVPIAKDDTLSLASVQALFPGSIGLKYKNPGTGNMRSLVVEEGSITAPDGGWGEHVYLAVAEAPAPVPEPATPVGGNVMGRASAAGVFQDVNNAQAVANKAAKEAHAAAEAAAVIALAASARAAGLSEPCPKIFVGHLPFTIAAPAQLFPYFPSAIDIQVPTHADTGRPKGFGFVTFASSTAAAAAIETMQGGMVEGRAIKLDYAPQKAGAQRVQQTNAPGVPGSGVAPVVSGSNYGLLKQSEKAARLYIGNLPFAITGAESLEPYFPGATSITVPTHPDSGKIKGYGYITYETADEAEEAMNKNKGLELSGRVIALDFAPFGGRGGGGGGGQPKHAYGHGGGGGGYPHQQAPAQTGRLVNGIFVPDAAPGGFPAYRGGGYPAPGGFPQHHPAPYAPVAPAWSAPAPVQATEQKPAADWAQYQQQMAQYQAYQAQMSAVSGGGYGSFPQQ